MDFVFTLFNLWLLWIIKLNNKEGWEYWNGILKV